MDDERATEQWRAPERGPERCKESYPGHAPLALVVDDEPAIRTLVRRVLELNGWLVVEAGDGEAALQATRGLELDLLVSDYEMPNGSGISLTAALRRRQAGLPVVLISGRLELPERLPRGQTRFVHKPFPVSELISTIGALLDAA